MEWGIKKTVAILNEDKEFFEEFYGIDLSTLTPELAERLMNLRREGNLKELLALIREITKKQIDQFTIKNLNET